MLLDPDELVCRFLVDQWSMQCRATGRDCLLRITGIVEVFLQQHTQGCLKLLTQALPQSCAPVVSFLRCLDVDKTSAHFFHCPHTRRRPDMHSSTPIVLPGSATDQRLLAAFLLDAFPPGLVWGYPQTHRCFPPSLDRSGSNWLASAPDGRWPYTGPPSNETTSLALAHLAAVQACRIILNRAQLWGVLNSM